VLPASDIALTFVAPCIVLLVFLRAGTVTEHCDDGSIPTSELLSNDTSSTSGSTTTWSLLEDQTTYTEILLLLALAISSFEIIIKHVPVLSGSLTVDHVSQSNQDSQNSPQVTRDSTSSNRERRNEYELQSGWPYSARVTESVSQGCPGMLFACCSPFASEKTLEFLRNLLGRSATALSTLRASEPANDGDYKTYVDAILNEACQVEKNTVCFIRERIWKEWFAFLGEIVNACRETPAVSEDCSFLVITGHEAHQLYRILECWLFYVQRSEENEHVWPLEEIYTAEEVLQRSGGHENESQSKLLLQDFTREFFLAHLATNKAYLRQANKAKLTQVFEDTCSKILHYITNPRTAGSFQVNYLSPPHSEHESVVCDRQLSLCWRMKNRPDCPAEHRIHWTFLSRAKVNPKKLGLINPRKLFYNKEGYGSWWENRRNLSIRLQNEENLQFQLLIPAAGKAGALNFFVNYLENVHAVEVERCYKRSFLAIVDARHMIVKPKVFWLQAIPRLLAPVSNLDVLFVQYPQHFSQTNQYSVSGLYAFSCSSLDLPWFRISSTTGTPLTTPSFN
jgi:hypothetical protein